MASDRQERENLLRKIRALMTKADDPGVTPEEADAFRAGADKLMTKYAVEQYELMKAGQNVHHKVVTARVDIRWWNQMRGDRDVFSWTHQMFLRVYEHARCIPMISKVDWGDHTLLVAGFPGDLEYADLLFTSLHLQLVNSIDPKPDPGLDLYENSVRMREAGLQWRDVMRKLSQAGMMPDKWNDGSQRAYVAYSQWVKKRYGQRFKSNHQTYRRAFTQGFVGTVSRRLREMEQATAETTTTDSSDTYALVLRDVLQTVQEWIYQEFPELQPKEPSPGDSIQKGRRVRAYRDNRRFDYSAMTDGVKAGTDANITGNPGTRLGDKDIKNLEW